MQHVDAIIVGGRCAGSSTARLLAQGGMRVVVMDRATFPSDTVSTHSISWHGVSLLQRWGLFDRLRSAGTPNPQVISVKIGAFELSRMRLGEDSPGSFAPRRTLLDAFLVDAARDAGADVWTETTVDDLVFDGTRVVGVRGRRAGAPFEVRAEVVIGADGVRSRVADRVRAAHYDVRPSATAGVYAYFADTGIDHPQIALVAGSGVLGFVTNDDLACIGALLPDERAGELIGGGDAGFEAVVARVAPALQDAVNGARRVTRFVTFRPHPSSFRVPFGDGWALVGDAGHYKDPITGQGIADAFLDAQLLSDALLGAGDLAEFRRRRDEIGAEMHDITGALSTLEGSNEEVLALFLRFRAAVEATARSVANLGAITHVAAG